MAGELLIHLGFAKAGSTAIQRAVAAGAVRCPSLSLDYPEPETHNPFAMSLRPAQRHAARRRPERAAAMARRLRACEGDLALLSAEAFENVPPPELRRFLSARLSGMEGRVRLIAYVRPHVARTVSAFAERTKKGEWTGTLAEHHARTLASGNALAWRRLSAWRDAFGDALTVRPMIRERLHGRSVVRDFARWAFRGAPFEVDDLPPQNESLSLRDLAIMAEIHREVARHHRGTGAAQVALGWHMQPVLAALPEAAPVRVAADAALVARMQEDFAEDAARVDEAFMEGTPLQDALRDAGRGAPEAPQSLDPETHLPPAELRTVRAAARFLGRMMAADPAGFARLARGAASLPAPAREAAE